MKYIFLLFFSTTLLFCMDKQNEISEMEKFFKDSSDFFLEHYFELMEDVNCEIEKHTPLDWMIRFKRIDFIKHLISKGADVNKKSGPYLPLYLALPEYGLKDSLDKSMEEDIEKNMKMIKLLLDAGADAYKKDDFKLSPFEYAKFFKMEHLVKYFESDVKSDSDCNVIVIGKISIDKS